MMRGLMRGATLLIVVLSLASIGCATKPEDIVYDSTKGDGLFLVGLEITADVVTKRVRFTEPRVTTSLSFMRSSMWTLPDGRDFPIPHFGAEREFAQSLGTAYHEGIGYHLFQGRPGTYALSNVGRRLVVHKTTFLSNKTFRERGHRYLNTWSFQVQPGSVAYIGNLKVDLDRDPPLVDHEPGGRGADLAFRQFEKITLPMRRVGLLSRRDSPVGFNPHGYGRESRLTRSGSARSVDTP